MMFKKRSYVSSANSPDSLLLLCVRVIVVKNVEFNGLYLPQEISNLMLEVFSETYMNKDLSESKVSSFLSQFKKSNTRMTVGLLSNLPLSNATLARFLKEQSANLIHLEIDNCPNLSQESLAHMYNIATTISDYEKVICSVKITKRDPTTSETTVVSKLFEDGWLSITENDTTYQQQVGHVKDATSLCEVLGLFEYPFFKNYYQSYCLPYSDTNGKVEQNRIKCLNSKIVSDDNCDVIETNEDCHPKVTLDIATIQKCPLQGLVIGSAHVLPDCISREYDRSEYIIHPLLPLRKLVIHDWTSVENSSYLNKVITPQMQVSLQYLDLSNCPSIGDGKVLLGLEVLKTLILYNCPRLHQALNNISQLQTLRVLDISSSNERYGHGFKHPDQQLATLVTSLSSLTHLDISGTNLAGPRCDKIKGLASRYSRPLEFLGVYYTATEAAYRHPLPALSVAGDATEAQILTACEVYINRVEFLRRTLNDLFHCFRFETDFHDVNRALDVVLLSMANHLQEKQIQIAASASLFYIVKSDEAKHNFNIKVKRQIIVRLLDAMQAHKRDSTMLRNGSLTLIHFKIPQDVLFEYARLVEILLYIVTSDEDNFIQRLGIFLLNSLACQVDGDQKTLVGDLGAIDKMLLLIENRIHRRMCDEVMETAWSTMWNVTDETPVNCERFLNRNGMSYFLQCMEIFPNSAELLRNMMGLLGNVAECKHLRHQLMKPEYIERCSDLLRSESDGIEVSYNAAGILSHIISDGEAFWKQHLPSVDRNDVLRRMREAISRWRINSKRNINYRSFEPILRLLKTDGPISEAQYWAAWALANLTRVYASKYCPLIIEEKGLQILRKLIQRDDVPTHIRDLSVLTIFQVERWKERGTLDGLEESDKIEAPNM